MDINYCCRSNGNLLKPPGQQHPVLNKVGFNKPKFVITSCLNYASLVQLNGKWLGCSWTFLGLQSALKLYLGILKTLIFEFWEAVWPCKWNALHQHVSLHKRLPWIWLLDAENEKVAVHPLSLCSICKWGKRQRLNLKYLPLLLLPRDSCWERERKRQTEGEAGRGTESLDLFVLDQHTNFLQKLFSYLPHSNDA